MDWKFLLFSLVVAGAAGILLILAMVSPTAFTIALALALLYPSYAVMAKRFQDRNKPGVLALFGIVPLVSSNLLRTFGYLDPENPSADLADLRSRGGRHQPLASGRARHPEGHAGP